MKAAAASLATALVLVSAAWAGNVTPQQLSKLNARVTHLETQVTALQHSTSCFFSQWNAQKYEPYNLDRDGGFSTNDGYLTLFVAPSQPDGIVGKGYLVVSPSVGTTC